MKRRIIKNVNKKGKSKVYHYSTTFQIKYRKKNNFVNYLIFY